MQKKAKYTKAELLRYLENVARLRPMSSTRKLEKFFKTQDDIMSGKIKTISGIRKRFYKTKKGK